MNKLTTLVGGLEMTKDVKTAITNDFIGMYLDGDYDPIQIECRLKLMGDIISDIRKDVRVKNALSDELSKHPKGKFENGNVVVQMVERKTIDYSSDPEITIREAKVKARETFLKSIKEKTFDPDTGEEIFPMPFKTAESVKISY